MEVVELRSSLLSRPHMAESKSLGIVNNNIARTRKIVDCIISIRVIIVMRISNT
jgi:hypothetical protein